MHQESVRATIKSKFDLGYIVELESGEEAQLRILEQKDRELEYHIAGTEELIYGESIFVYITYRDDRYCSVSQFSPSERTDREEVEIKKANARGECEIGNIYAVKIEKDYEWGYLCSQVDGFLSGTIKKPTLQLRLDQQVTVVVVGKNKHGAPYFEIHRDSSNV
jgi:hypothetical protein